jgi:hypothetical protein
MQRPGNAPHFHRPVGIATGCLGLVLFVAAIVTFLLFVLGSAYAAGGHGNPGSMLPALIVAMAPLLFALAVLWAAGGLYFERRWGLPLLILLLGIVSLCCIGFQTFAWIRPAKGSEVELIWLYVITLILLGLVAAFGAGIAIYYTLRSHR